MHNSMILNEIRQGAHALHTSLLKAERDSRNAREAMDNGRAVMNSVGGVLGNSPRNVEAAGARLEALIVAAHLMHVTSEEIDQAYIDGVLGNLTD